MKTRLFNLAAERRADLVRSLGNALAAESGIAFAYLHGSFAAGMPFHDIDVGVYFDDASHDESRRALDLTDRLSRHVGYPVDVRVLNDAPVPFQFRVLQGTLLASRDDQRLAEVLENVGRRYLDMEPLLRRATREAFAR